MAMELDLREFDKRFKTLVETSVPSAVSWGIFRAGNELLRDAIYKVPKAPFEEGHLRASAMTMTSDGVLRPFNEAPDPMKAINAKDGDEYSLVAGFNIVYAHRWHELTPEEDARINWTLDGSGRKYLETKMIRYKEDYAKIVANYLANLLASGGRK